MKTTRIYFVILIVSVLLISSCDLANGGPVLSTAEELSEPVVKIKEAPSDAEEYLYENSGVLDIESEWTIPFDFSEAELIIIGEHHSTKDIIYTMKVGFIKYFNKQYGIRIFLGEWDVYIGYYISKYMETGDESYLSIFKTRNVAYLGIREFYYSLQDLYEYNSSLPDDAKLIFVPIDSTGWYGYEEISVLQKYLPVDGVPGESIKNLIDDLKSADLTITNIKSVSLCKRIKSSLENYTEEFKNYLGTNYDMFWYSVNKILRTYDAWTQNGSYHELRDKAAYLSVLDVCSIYPDEKYMSQYGNAHIFQKKAWESTKAGITHTWVSRVKNSESKLKNKVVSVNTIFFKCKQVNLGSDEVFDDNSDFRISHYFKKVAKQKGASFMIFSLVEEGSPFFEDSYIVFNPSGGVTTDYFQYVLLIKNSDAGKWW